MPRDPLQHIIGLAIVDKDFRQSLLTDPVEATRDFALSEADVTALASIRARSFEQFAAKVDQLGLRRPSPRDRWVRRDEGWAALKTA